jgi:Uncharacterized protein conserved in bacteria
MVPISNVSVYGPGQKAIIAWNGEEEILILSTDVRASGDSQVLEILPLPSEPEIEKGDFASFEQVDKLIKEHFPTRLWDRARKGTVGPPGEGVEIVFHEKIGAHDITVVKATDSSELVKWAEKFLKDVGIEYRISSPRLESVAGEYIAGDINFFVFDLIEVSAEPKSIEPIKYRFDTEFLYYPLKISTLAEGWTDINLFLLTPQPVNLHWLPQGSELPQGLEIGKFYGSRGAQPIQFKLTQEELASIDKSIGGFLEDDAWLTTVSYHGDLAGLTGDLKLVKVSLTPELIFDCYQGRCASEQKSQAIIGNFGNTVVACGLAITPTPCYELEAKVEMSSAFAYPPTIIVDITAREEPGACIECLGEIPFRAKIDGLVSGAYDIIVQYQGKIIAQERVFLSLSGVTQYFELAPEVTLMVSAHQKELRVYIEQKLGVDELNPDVVVRARLKGNDMKLHTAYLQFNESSREAMVEVNGIPVAIKISPSYGLRIEDSQLFLDARAPLLVQVMPDEVVSSLKAAPEYLELKDVDSEAIYEFKGISREKVLGMVPIEIEIEAQIDATTGDIIKQQKPWWAIFCWEGVRVNSKYS